MADAERPVLMAAVGPWVDNVKRWNRLKNGDYPEASYAFADGWYIGALRDVDNVLRARDLGQLIAALLDREPAPEPAPVRDV